MAIQNVVLPMTGEELKDKLNEMISQFVATTTEYGDTGRLRYDPSTKHFYFEVKQSNGNWLIKAEIGASIIVDALRLIKAEKPTNILPNEIAYYNKEITLSNGDKILRPHYVLPDGTEYSIVVNEEGSNTILFRNSVTNQLVEIPVIYEDSTGKQFTDLDKIKFTGNVSVTKDIDKTLRVDITGGSGGVSDTAEQIKTKLETLIGDERLDISAIKGSSSDRNILKINDDLTITDLNYESYDDKTIILGKIGLTTQSIVLPNLNTFTKKIMFVFINARTTDNPVDIRAVPGNTINGNDFIRLLKEDYITIENIKDDTDWVITSITRTNIVDNKIDGGGA